MLRIANLGDSIYQSTFLFRLEHNMEVDSGASGWVAQSLPVDWDGMPGMLDLHVVPRYNGRREIGEGYWAEEEHKYPEVLHDYRRSARNVQIKGLEI